MPACSSKQDMLELPTLRYVRYALLTLLLLILSYHILVTNLI